MSNLRRSILLSGLALSVFATANAQSWKDAINKAKSTIDKSTGSTSTGNYTNTEAVSALKQALEIGTQNASGRLASVNGFFGNQLIKIVMPPEARMVESTLRSVGMGAHVDKAILSMNRAAEDAASKAVPIFVDAIKTMTIQDGIGIVKGGQGSATNYLKSRTTQSLTNSFRPVIESSLRKVDATKYWSNVFTIYNRLPTTTTKVNPDLAGYVTEKALSGLFVTIAEEENKIRTNPASRVTDLLRKVFGGK